MLNGRQFAPNGSNRKKDSSNTTRIYTLHLECAADHAQEAHQKLSKWYGSASKMFPDGTKMHLIPLINTILSSGNRQKYASLIIHQSALNTRIGSCSTWEMPTNLLLDKPEPSSGVTFRQLMLGIPSQVFRGTLLFHSVDKLWRSENGIVFTFLPENDSDARNVVAGLVPFLKDTADSWFLKMFTPEAKIQHMSSKWDQATRQVFSAEEFEVEEFLADDDEYNKSDEPTVEKPSRRVRDESHIQVDVPIIIDPEDFPNMYDADSVSTFHKVVGNSKKAGTTSTKFTPMAVSNPPSILASLTSESRPRDVNYQADEESISKMSDKQSRISTLEQDFKHLNSSLQSAFADMKLLSQQHSFQQQKYDATLAEILQLLKQV